MDQGAELNRPARKQRFFKAPLPGGRVAARLQQLRSRTWLLVVLAAMIALYLFYVSAGGARNWPVYGTYLDLQADGFREGHTYVPLKPAPELLAAANPRDRVNIRYWPLDLSYFEGKFYTYWGPFPPLVQALFKSVLGIRRTIGDAYIGLVAGCLCMCAGALVIERLARRLFGGVPRVAIVFTILAFACANPMLHSVTTAGTYVGAIISAQAMLMLGTLIAFDAVWYANTSSARPARLWLAGLCWGCAIASRITVGPAVAFLIVITALADAWMSKRRWWSAFVNALRLGAPVAVIVAGLLIYNQVRFRDPLQFGIKLQLSGYPPLNFKLKYWIPNLYSYSLRPFVASCQFPYIWQTWWIKQSAAFPEGFTVPVEYNTDEPTVGWLVAVPVSWFIGFALWFAPRRLSLPLRHERVYWWCVLAFGAMATLPMAVSIGAFGTTMRYLTDITPGLVLLGVLGAFALRASRFGVLSPKATTSSIVVLASATIFLGCALGYQGYNGHFHRYHSELDAVLVKSLSFCGGADPHLPRFTP